MTLSAIRLALLIVALFNMAWTANGVLFAFRRVRSPFATFKSAIFFLSAGTFAFQAFAVFGAPNDATRFWSCLTLLIGLATAASLYRQTAHLSKFGRLLANVDAALAIVDLSMVDQKAADQQAARCRALTARLMNNG